MILYHRTNERAAQRILRHGFRDAPHPIGFAGVFFSCVPLTVAEGAKGDVVLRVTLPDRHRREIEGKYEWFEDGNPYREFQTPAAWINTRARRVTRALPAEVDQYWLRFPLAFDSSCPYVDPP